MSDDDPGDIVGRIVGEYRVILDKTEDADVVNACRPANAIETFEMQANNPGSVKRQKKQDSAIEVTILRLFVAEYTSG